jgi:PadR family transcriptional regulator AphA
MNVKTLCLGVLCEHGKASGYEIRKMLKEDGAFSHFVDAGYGSIYPALNKLSDEGLVIYEAQEQANRPDKKVYQITPAGRMALLDTLLKAPAPDKLRSPFLFTLFFGDLLPARHVDQLVDERIGWYSEALQRIGECDRSRLSTGASFVQGYGEAVYKAAHDYLESNKHVLVAESLQAEQDVAE